MKAKLEDILTPIDYVETFHYVKHYAHEMYLFDILKCHTAYLDTQYNQGYPILDGGKMVYKPEVDKLLEKFRAEESVEDRDARRSEREKIYPGNDLADLVAFRLREYALLPSAQKDHRFVSGQEMTQKGEALQNLIFATVQLLRDEGVIVSVEQALDPDFPRMGQGVTKIETRWDRPIYQHFMRLNDEKLRKKTIDELNEELNSMAQVTEYGKTLQAEHVSKKWIDVGHCVNGVVLSDQAMVAEHVLSKAIKLGLDLFTANEHYRNSSAPCHTGLAVVGDTYMAPVGVVKNCDDSQIDHAVGAPLGVLDELEAPVDAEDSFAAFHASRLSQEAVALAGDFGSYDVAEQIVPGVHKFRFGLFDNKGALIDNAVAASIRARRKDLNIGRGFLTPDFWLLQDSLVDVSEVKPVDLFVRTRDDSSPVAMGHPYEPYPKLTPAAVVENVNQYVDRVKDQRGVPVIMNPDGSLEYYPV
jgi:hypothetical protein